MAPIIPHRAAERVEPGPDDLGDRLSDAGAGPWRGSPLPRSADCALSPTRSRSTAARCLIPAPPDTGSVRRAEMSALDRDIAALPGLSARELRAAWRALRCGDPTAGSSRDLLLREIAYKMQERAHGGLAAAVKRRLRALAEDVETNGAGALAPALLLKPGTRLLREWQGRPHTVIVLDDGFEYDGERHRSLTQIAGAHWSGPRFFGLRKALASRPAAQHA
jgi:hypothetical protein